MTEFDAALIEPENSAEGVDTMPEDDSRPSLPLPDRVAEPSVVIPDRANAPVSEVTERFLRAILDKVPLDRIEELHLFAPLRQGGAETGIAVVAARVPVLLSDDAPPVTVIRHTVYTAHYRLVLKGVERGKWESDVVDEADAPLVTVETVVRGVQRRAGEDTEILRYNDRQIARALRLEWPQSPVAQPV